MNLRVFLIIFGILFLFSCKSDFIETHIECNSITDIDGYTYKTVKIGNQCWMAENLRVSRYRNGDLIPEIVSKQAWSRKTGAWCYYNNDSVIGRVYGKLYNWDCVNDSRGLAPAGWHVASDSDWAELEVFIGMADSVVYHNAYRGTVEGNKLKESGTEHWKGSSPTVSNEFGFTALPGGMRDGVGDFYALNSTGMFWTLTESKWNESFYRRFEHYISNIGRYEMYKNDGFSVRCVKDK